MEGSVHPAGHPLDPVLRPASLAVIGASRDPTKRGHQVIRALQRAGYPGPIYPVNPAGGELLGLPVAPSLAALEGRPDLAVVCTPAASVPDVVEACAGRGVRGAVVLASGFGETGARGAALERRLLRVVRRTGIRLIGPNTSGLLNLPAGLDLLGVDGVRLGRVALLSQSGNVALQLLNELRARPDTGVSVYVGIGNELDVGFDEVLDFLAADPNTAVVAAYVEGLRDGRAFLDVARRMVRDKPIVVLKGGRSSAGRAAVRSHTGAVAGEAAVFRAALAHAGVVQVERSDELLPVALMLAGQPPAAPGGVAILSDGGGHATLAADALVALGTPLARPRRSTRARLAALLGERAQGGNPVDLAGAADRDPGVFPRVLEALLQDPGVAGVLVAGLFGGYAIRFADGLREEERRAAEAMAVLPGRTGKPLVFHSLYADRHSEAIEVLRRENIPVLASLELAARSIAAAQERGGWLQRPQVRLSRAARPRPQAFQAARREGRGRLLEPEARALVASYGVPMVPGRFCASAAEAAAAADEYAGPVALKVVSRSISHKTEAGGVLLDVRGALAARRGYARLRQRAVAHLAGADGARGFEGVLVTRMLPPPTAELLVGARRDDQFGPILTIGLGGTAVELLREVAIRPLPLSRAEVLEMLQGGRIDRALAGLRGRPAASREALASLALHLADCLLANPEIAELECNPVFAGPGAAVAVDVRLVLQEPRRGARQRDREPVRLRRRAAGA